jgi:hypothetical protein
VLSFRLSEHIDDLWFTVAKAVVAGRLGLAAKVSSKNPTEKTHVICVYNEDFTDEADVKRIEKGLRELGIHIKMSYKADIFTTLGIYAKNDFGIRPTIYYSKALK